MDSKQRTSEFSHRRFGMFIHWGLYSIAARHEWLQHIEAMDAASYARYIDRLNPDKLDPRKWAAQARRAGMRYVILTTKHHDGFCLWDSETTAFKITNSPCKRDLVQEFVEACRAEDLQVGLYFSLIDWHHPHFTLDSLHPETLRLARKYGGFRPGMNHCQFDTSQIRDPEFHHEIATVNKSRNMAVYRDYMKAQLNELLTQYGPVDILWFDFSYKHFFSDGKTAEDWDSEGIIEEVKALQPHILINNRLDLPEEADFFTPEQTVPYGPLVDRKGKAITWEGCHTFSGSWGYHRDEHNWKSETMLIQLLVDHVSRNGNLLLNVGPDGRGAFCDRAMQALEGVARWMDLHQDAIYGCGAPPTGLEPPSGCRYTYCHDRSKLYIHLYYWPFQQLHLPGLAGRVKDACLQHDRSELLYNEIDDAVPWGPEQTPPAGTVTLLLPTIPPPTPIPVIEITLQDPTP